MMDRISINQLLCYLSENDYICISIKCHLPTMPEFSSYKDQELVTLLRESNSDAFEIIYRRYWTILYDKAYKRLAEKQLVEDILQNVFTRLWKRRNEACIENLPAYLATSVRYEVIHILSSAKNITHFYEPFENALKEVATPEGNLVAKELLNIVYQYADTLTERKKEIFLLYFREHHNTKEISEILGITRKTVQNQLHSALLVLKKKVIPLLFFIILMS